MLQLQVIRDQSQKVLTGLKKRNFKDAESLITNVIETDKLRRETQQELDEIKAQANSNSKKIGELKKAGKDNEANNLLASITLSKEKTKLLEDNLSRYEADLQQLLYKIPNIPAEKVPAGKTPEDNITTREWGKFPPPPADAQPHWELIKKYNIIDFELGVKISGAGFPVYKGKGARLQRALINFFLDEAHALGYTEIQPPILVNADSPFGTGHL